MPRFRLRLGQEDEIPWASAPLVIEARRRQHGPAVGVITRVKDYAITSSELYYDGEASITCGG